ncbi:uncharacterized protein (DUF1800 family) [Mycoplana sp. BE70]|uniref:DUF1800 domain-containing protein n=1 Tax=Mycoplana sp. BE70 TaxID=2817775 RepID=UPI0028584B7D|nr:DUF1800 domain-containing protein [Mycoplana sp. BE70]MDR6758557.1 uncharacterized protein (DUF1800 family) [Mycoplana sp. BE70]
MSISFGTMAARRFGYGLRSGEVPPQTVDELIQQVKRGVGEVSPFPYDGIAGRRASFQQFRLLAETDREARKNGTVRKVGGRPVNLYQIGRTAAFLRDQHLKVQHVVSSPNGFYERLASFWSDHFAISAVKAPNMRFLVALYEAEALRPNLAGSFEQLLRAAVMHPAMLIYLDQSKSIGPNSPFGTKKGRGLNENLARELIELHTMGAGSGYTQDDVRAAAYVLTGLDFEPWVFETLYRPSRAEPGVHHVLGRDYGGEVRSLDDVNALLADLAAKPETRRHICRKLVAHFVTEDPPVEVVQAMETAWERNGGSLVEVYRAMLEHPRSWEQDGQKARQPFDFVVAGLRALDVPVDALEPLPAAVDKTATVDGSMIAPMELEMGQPLVAPADGAAMAETDLIAAPTADGKIPIRANPLTVGVLQILGQPLWRPPSPAGWDESISTWVTASQLAQRIAWIRRLVKRFGGSSDPRALLQAVLADAARDDTIQVVAGAPSRDAGLSFVLASPEFNRR